MIPILLHQEQSLLEAKFFTGISAFFIVLLKGNFNITFLVSVYENELQNFLYNVVLLFLESSLKRFDLVLFRVVFAELFVDPNCNKP